MVGLDQVDNTSDLNKPISTATQTALNLKAPLANPSFTGTVSGITKSMVGLGNADNTSDLNKPISTATQSALDLKAPIANPTFTGTVSGISKTMVGLSNVDNTSDVNKPISTATQAALSPLQTNTTNQTYSNGTTTFLTDIFCNTLDISQNVAVGNNLGVGSICSVGALDCLTSVNCDSIQVNTSCQYNFKTVGYITSFFLQDLTPPVPFIPLCKSIFTPTQYCSGSIDLADILFQLPPNIYVYLYPGYKIVIYDDVGCIIYSLDNTTGTDIIINKIVNTLINVSKILIYCNNLPIL
jgi:hypothetical protein